MVTTIVGKNTFLVRQQRRQLVEEFVATHGEHAVERYEASEVSTPTLRAALSSVSMFAPQRMVVVEGIQANKQLLGDIEELLSDTLDEISVVLVADGELDKRTAAYKYLRKETNFIDCAPLAESQLAEWAQAFAVEEGSELSASLARKLVQRSGADQWKLAKDIQKLAAFASPITAEAIETLVDASPQESVFNLLDAVLNGTKNWQFQLRQMQQTIDAYEFFGLLVWQVHAVALVGAATSADQLAQAKLAPFVAQKSRQLAKKWGSEGCAAAVVAVAQLDVQLKSSGMEPWVLIEQALHHLQQAATKKPS